LRVRAGEVIVLVKGNVHAIEQKLPEIKVGVWIGIEVKDISYNESGKIKFYDLAVMVK